MDFQVCSNSAYPQHSGERYKTNGLLVYGFEVPGHRVFIFFLIHMLKRSKCFILILLYLHVSS